MLLIISNSLDQTTNYLHDLLLKKGVPTFRLDSDRLIEHVNIHYSEGCGLLTSPTLQICNSQVRNVWFRRPRRLIPSLPSKNDSAELRNIELEYSEAIEGFLAHVNPVKWINHPSNNVLASHKIEQLTRARSFGLNVPRTLVTQTKEELLQFWQTCNKKIIIKPLASGYLEREYPNLDTQIYTNVVVESDLTDLDSLRNCPSFFQEAINKFIDVRITVIDTHIHAVGLLAKEPNNQQRLDIRRNNMNDVEYQHVQLPQNVENNLLKLLNSYHLRFAAIDMAIDQDGQWIFFEINPNGQWAWLDLAGVTNIAESFIRVFSS